MTSYLDSYYTTKNDLKSFYNMEEINLINGDCLKEMSKIEDESVNCIITSPPYNVNLGNNKYKKDGYNSYDDNLPYKEYLSFMNNVFILSKKVLSKDGRLCINIGDGKNGNIPTHSDFIQMLIKLDFIPITTIVWNKNNTSNRCAWGSYLSAKSPSFPRPFEYILVFGKTKSLLREGKSTINKEEWKEYSNGLWTFNAETKQKSIGHPAMFPIELPTRLIKMLTYENDIVLDPFMGSGTTGVACIENNRKFIGFEIDNEYYKKAKERIDNVINEKQQMLF